MTSLLFSKGKRVEVSLEKVENCEVWFPAVVEEETGNNCFLVEYQCIGKNGVPESLRVKVDFLHIRPSPPQFVKNYDLLEKVDAYLDFGWWSGVITKELPDSKYLIFFKQTKKQRIVNQSEIRAHMEWKEGNWFSASQELLQSPDHQGSAKNPHQTALVVPGGLTTLKENAAQGATSFFNLLDIRNEWLAPSNIEPSTLSQRKKTKLLGPNTDEQNKMMKQADMADLSHMSTNHLTPSSVGNRDEEIHFGWATGTDGGAKTTNLEQSMGDQLSDKISRTTRRKRARSKVKRYKPVESKSTTYSLRIYEGRLLESPTSETQALAGDKTHDDVRCTKENFVERECVTEVPVTCNLECEVIEASQSDKLPPTPPEEMVEPSGHREQQYHDPAVNATKEADELEGHKESTGKRKRGRRPRKFTINLEVSQENVDKLAKSPEVSHRQSGGVVAADTASEVLPVVVGLKAAQVHGSVSKKGRRGVDKKIVTGSAHQESKLITNIEVSPLEKVEHHEMDSSKGATRRSTRINAKYLNQDASSGKIAEANAKDGLIKEAETSLTFNLSDDQPLSMWMGSSKATSATCASQGMNMEPGTSKRSPKDIAMLSSQSNDDDSLPFVKSSSLWKSIESMEVFLQLPQRPHFQSLCSRKESSREGLAIALMVNFAGVVEKTSTLKIDDPRSTIEDKLETLTELEKNGFDVKVVRDRLLRLLLIKDKQEELQANSKETTDKIKEINQDKIKIDERIEEIDNQIRLLQEERALVLSTKGEKDSSIAALEVKSNELSSSIKNASLEFEALVAVPLPGA
ncbi:hypothetical protein DCAR_0103052 [Daucus carota subsp. sativus]|uniref:Agenet domain-containing protein n=1 Tax=Daucus carota subsp. sativus TaxID=79200 RepID=A0AAF0W7K0_DAUCS|nr:hypothetical protein DCAR_0103052 [Daucus carota subsp. sativus]